ncbi:MAG: DUF134 domain-containing protein [Lentihominibacter sp.]
MPRPKKCRKICGIPKCCQFGPMKQDADEQDAVEMTLDEYETIRLIDYLGYNQEMCAQQMGVARTTVQAVYNEARKKLSMVLIEGRLLYIKGGNYIVCPRTESCATKRGCGHGSCSYCSKISDD